MREVIAGVVLGVLLALAGPVSIAQAGHGGGEILRGAGHEAPGHEGGEIL